MSSPSPRSTLIFDTVRGHRRGIVAWSLGWTVAMVVIAAGYASEVARVEGGAVAMARSIEAGAEAMRLLRWPVERLDTLGGYLTYHNVVLFTFFLCVYAGVQGAGAVRDAEAGHVLEVMLATGRSRRAVLVDRALGFAVVLAVIGVAFGAGLALALAVGGEADTAGSFLTAAACVSSALAAYGIGSLVSQFTPTARAGRGVTALVLTVLYLLTNVADNVGVLGIVRVTSPTYWFNRSRALVPGHDFDLAAVAFVMIATVGLLAGAAWAFERRDLGAALVHRAPKAGRAPERVQRPVLAHLWTAILHRERIGLISWSVATAFGFGLLAWLEPAVRDVWDKMTFSETMFGNPAFSVSDQYLAMSGEMLAPLIAAFVVTQAVGWVADLEQGRVELLLAGPLSWTGLVRQRLAALLAGVLVLTVAAEVGLLVGAAAVGVTLSVAGMARLALDALLLGAALGAVSTVVVAWTRSGMATMALAGFLGASYLLVLLTQLFAWPEWLVRVSVFGAFGHPYLEVPAAGGLLFLALVAVGAAAGAVVVAERSPKVA